MKVQTTLRETLRQIDIIKDYDASCKRLLSERRILAEIMKSCLEEFREYDSEELVSESIQKIASEREEEDWLEETLRIQSMGQEDVEEAGRITYDVKYSAMLPRVGKSKYLINVEAQNDYYPGYPIITRGIYYGSRMISAQYGTEFHHAEYGKIKKVYSIWICTNPPRYKCNTITKYGTREENVVGVCSEQRKHYDLLSVIMICLGEEVEEVGEYSRILKLLNILFRSNLDVSKKIEILEQEFQIPMTYEMKGEMNHMCNLGEGIARRAMEEGIEEGIEQRNIYLIREKSQKGLDKEQISEFLELEESYVEQVIEIVKENLFMSDVEIVKLMNKILVSNYT